MPATQPSASTSAQRRLPLSTLSLSPFVAVSTRPSTPRKPTARRESTNMASSRGALLPSPSVASTTTPRSHQRSRSRSTTPFAVAAAAGPLSTLYEAPSGMYSPRTLSRVSTTERDSPARRMMESEELETLQPGEDEANVSRGTATPSRRLLDMFLQSASPEVVKRTASAAESPGPSRQNSAGSASEAPTWTFYEDADLDLEPEFLADEDTPMEDGAVEDPDSVSPPSNENVPPPSAPPQPPAAAMAPPPPRHRRSTSLLSQHSVTSTTSASRPTSTTNTPTSTRTSTAARSPASSSTLAQSQSQSPSAERAQIATEPPTTPPPFVFVPPADEDALLLDDDDDDDDKEFALENDFGMERGGFADTGVVSFERPSVVRLGAGESRYGMTGQDQSGHTSSQSGETIRRTKRLSGEGEELVAGGNDESVKRRRTTEIDEE